MTPAPSGHSRRWLFGDQLGPHFLDDDHQHVVMVESSRVLRRQTFPRQKAHLVLSAMRHRAAELGDRATYVRSDSYRGGLAEVEGPLDVIQPTTFAAARLVADLTAERPIQRHPARGFASSRAEFVGWASRRGGRPLLMEDYYRETRRRLGVLMEGDSPVGGQWSFDADHREPSPKTARLRVAEPGWPTEDAIDAEVRADLDALAVDGVQFVGADAPRRLAATRAEALIVLADFIGHRLPTLGRYKDAVVREDRWMANSILSAPLNLGLLDPLEVVRAAEAAYAAGSAPLAAVEGFIRQVIGWRDYSWHLYWFLGPDYRNRNDLQSRVPLSASLLEVASSGTDAAVPRSTVRTVKKVARTQHNSRLKVIGNVALQHGWDPTELTSWFHRSFVDGYDGVMEPTTVGRPSSYLRLRSS